MDLTASSAAPHNWARWPEQLPHNFGMMEAPSFMPYDTSGNPTAQIHRPVSPQVAPAYSSAPISSMSAPHYQDALPSTLVGSLLSSEPQDRGHPVLIGTNFETGRVASVHLDSRQTRQTNNAHVQFPVRSDSNVSVARSAASNSTGNSKTITYNETINPNDRVNFETDVDELMKAIQGKLEENEDEPGQTLTPAHILKNEKVMDIQSPASFCQTSSPVTEAEPRKKWVCDGPNCNKRFVQKTHLDIHRRTHTGLKPYLCTKDNCGLAFSQRGNLKTHMRRHTGEKPYSCSICGKTFAQRGNVRSHEETHKGLKPFICRLDDCNKSFSQLGNMKTHQNNFHKETLKDLTKMFVKFAYMGQVPDEHQGLFMYFKEHYKNSNKGIKGRGKARTVAVSKSKGTSHVAVRTMANQYTEPHMVNSASVNFQGNFGMFESEPGQWSSIMFYDDEPTQHMAFCNSLY